MQRPRSLQSRTDRFFSLMDYWLLIPVLLMTLIGLYVLNQVLAGGSGVGSYPMNFYKQAGAVLIGLIALLVICLFEMPTLRLFSYLIYGVSIVLLILVKVDGYSLRTLTGADSWIQLPLIGSFQPSELAKIGLAMLSANIFADMKHKQRSLLQGTLQLAVLYLVPLALIMTEPDFGTSMVIVFMFLCLLFIFGLKWRYIFLGLSAAVVAIPLIWVFYLSEVQQNRILTFLFPGHDLTASYHIQQSLKAISAGGLTGNPDGLTIPVPVRESDFIYTAISESMGLIGTAALVILIIIFLSRALILASRLAARETAAAFLIVALTAMMSFHFIENMGMCVGLLPITGIPLPFVSNGGSSMVVNYISLGLMLNISMNDKLLRLETSN